MLNILKVVFVIIGTIIGAGFSSGQEILIFFNKYGICGIIGMIISSLIIGIIIYKVLKTTLEKRIFTFQDFIENIMPYSIKQNKILMLTISNIVNIFLFISFIIMVSGFSTFIFQEFGTPKIIGRLIIAILAFYIFLKGMNGIIKINTYLIPAILLLIVLLGIKKINTFHIINSKQSVFWLISSIFYASYNSICLIPVLLSLKKHIHNMKEVRVNCFMYEYNYFYFIINNIFTFKFIFYKN